MRKIIAFTIICLLSLLLKNEVATSKSKCDVIIKARIAHMPVMNWDMDADTQPVPNSLKPYDGFFKKL